MQWRGFFLSICVTMNHWRWWKRKRDLSSSRGWTDHHEWRQARGWSCKVSSARKWDPSSQHVTSSALRVMRRVKNHMPISVGVCVCRWQNAVLTLVCLAFPFLVFHSDLLVSQCFLPRIHTWCPEPTERCSWHQASVVLMKQHNTIFVWISSAGGIIMFKFAQMSNEIQLGLVWCSCVGFPSVCFGFSAFFRSWKSQTFF